MLPAVGRSRPTAMCSKVVLPAPFGPTRPTTRPGGMARVQSDNASRRPYRLDRPSACSTGLLMRLLYRGAECGHEQGLDAFGVQPGCACPGEPGAQLFAERTVRGQRLVGQGPGDEGAHPGTRRDQTLVFEFPVRLEHRVRVDRHLRHHVLDRGQLVTLGQQPQPHGLADLLDQLHVGGDAGAAVQMELDHSQPSFI